MPSACVVVVVTIVVVVVAFVVATLVTADANYVVVLNKRDKKARGENERR